MKKITAREFQHSFSKTTAKLKPGQAVLVTKHGKALGMFTKASEGKPRKFRCPDFEAELQKGGFDKRIGQKVIDGISAAVLSGSGVSTIPAL
jgi:predicted GNAT family acetyltransferase